MTDSEIMRALEYCAESYDCDECPHVDIYYTQGCDVGKEALSLINRQQAKIERLIEENEFLRRYISVHEEPHLSQIVANYNGILATTKAEAIKEFAERLKNRYVFLIVCDWRRFNSEIDALVKEMVGDS